ncbi:MAG: FliI/YscN family ATPase [Nitrospirae bacterium]|nr:FliI/YscN family ATPase [Nitrospirota bacterium]
MSRFIMDALGLVDQIDPRPIHGRITQAIGIVLEGCAPVSAIGEICEVISVLGNRRILAEVVGFRDDKVLLMPLGDLEGIGPGSAIVNKSVQAKVAVGERILGRVLNGLGQPIDGKGPLQVHEVHPLYNVPPGPLQRNRITAPLDLGVRALNGLLTAGRGQRIGIFAGSGVGKSILLGMIARYTSADVNVIALIGERGREVKEFIEKDLNEEGLKRSVVVVATSDQPPLVRKRAAFLAMSIAEYFRDRNRQVLFMMDSLTRLAHAQREIGLSIGEPPATKGYTPSVFSLLPGFLERSGTGTNGGTMTGLFTVLTEGDDINDPIPDAVRAILDGHVILSREIAARALYPAIDILNSVSRVMIDIVDSKQIDRARRFSELLSTYQKAEDLINIGAYKAGSNLKIDQAIEKWEELQAYIRQDIHERVTIKESIDALARILP